MSNPRIAEASLKAGTRFPTNRQDHTQKHPNGYVRPMLIKLLSAEWHIEDKKIKKLLRKVKLKETVMVALILRKILNGTEGDGKDIEDIFDRLDGKVAQTLLGEGFSGDTKIIFIYPPNWKPKDERITDTTEKLSS